MSSGKLSQLKRVGMERAPGSFPGKKERMMEPGKGGRAGDETAHAGLKASEVGKHCESDRPSGIPNPSSIKTLSKHHMCRMRMCFLPYVWNGYAFNHSSVVSAISNVPRKERLTD